MYFILCAIFHSAVGARSQVHNAEAFLAYRQPHLHFLLEMLLTFLGNLSCGGLYAFASSVCACVYSYLVLLNPTLMFIDTELTDLFKTLYEQDAACDFSVFYASTFMTCDTNMATVRNFEV
jgi:hypothetical protein